MSSLAQFRSALHNAVPYSDPYADLDFGPRNVFAGAYYGEGGNALTFPAGINGYDHTLAIDPIARKLYSGSSEMLDWSISPIIISAGVQAFGFQSPANGPASLPYGADTGSGYGYTTGGSGARFPSGIEMGTSTIFSYAGSVGAAIQLETATMSAGGLLSVDWNNRTLHDTSGNIAAYWGGTGPNGTAYQLELVGSNTNLGVRYLADPASPSAAYVDTAGSLVTGSFTAVDWFNRKLYATGNFQALDWENRQLSDTSGIAVAGWGAAGIDALGFVTLGGTAYFPQGADTGIGFGYKSNYGPSYHPAGIDSGTAGITTNGGAAFFPQGVLGNSGYLDAYYGYATQGGWSQHPFGADTGDGYGYTTNGGPSFHPQGMDVTGTHGIQLSGGGSIVGAASMIATSGMFVDITDHSGASPPNFPVGVKLGVNSVVSLPSPSDGVQCYVVDADAPVIGSPVVGGGSSPAVVCFNGVDWIVIADFVSGGSFGPPAFVPYSGATEDLKLGEFNLEAKRLSYNNSSNHIDLAGFSLNNAYTKSVDWANAVLNSGGGSGNAPSLNWENRQLIDMNGSVIMQWVNTSVNANAISAIAGDSGIDFVYSQIGYLGQPVRAIDYGNRKLNDAGASMSVDWANRQLIAPDGTTVVADWSGTTPSGTYCALEIPTGYTIAADYIASRGVSNLNFVDLPSGRLYRGIDNVYTVDWANAQLRNTSGVVVDWANSWGVAFTVPIVNGSTGSPCIDPVTNALVDGLGSPILRWASNVSGSYRDVEIITGKTLFVDYVGSTSATNYVDLTSGSLINSTGFGSVDWANSQLKGPAGAQRLYWGGDGVDINGPLTFSTSKWDDLRFPAQAINPPGSASSPTVSTTTGMLEFSGTVDNVIAGQAQMPHSWKHGSAVNPHIHLLFPTANALSSRWKFEYTLIAPNGTATNAYGTYTNGGTITVANPNVASKSKLAAWTPIDMTGYVASSTILWRISRLSASDAADTDTSVVVLTEFDIHFEMDKIGSETEIPV